MRSSVARMDVFRCWHLLIVICFLAETIPSEGANFTIGVLLNEEDLVVDLSHVMTYINRNHLLGVGHTLDYTTDITRHIDTFASIRSVCNQLENGIVAIVGPLTSTETKAVASVAEAMNIPIVAPASTDPLLGVEGQYPTLVRMLAPDSVQSIALLSLVEQYGWKNMAILTSDSDYGTNGLLKFQAEAERRKWRVVTVRRFSVNDHKSINAISTLNDIKETGVRVVVLNCMGTFGIQVLQQAADLGMTGSGWAWLVTDGISVQDYKTENGSVPPHLRGLLGTRPVSGKGALWPDMERLWPVKEIAEQRQGKRKNTQALQGYLMDAVLLVAYAVADMIQDTGRSNLTVPPLGCSHQPLIRWTMGSKLLHYMAKVNKNGVASNIAFNSELYPRDPAYDIVSLTEEGWIQVGNWSESSGLTINRSQVFFMGGEEVVPDFVSSLANKTIRAVTIAEVPFVIVKNQDMDRDNIRIGVDIEGYCIDLMNKLAEMIGFNYTVYYIKDDMFGSKDVHTRQWNGLVKELIDRKADLALADLTITFAREEVIDFTKPYLDLGLTFIMKAEQPQDPNPFRFLDPFSADIWTYILLTTVLVAVCVSLVNKLSPYDYHGEFIYVDDATAKKNRASAFSLPGKYKVYSSDLSNFKEYKSHKKMKKMALAHMNFTNSLWFSLGALLQQGGECYPKSLSARITTVLWWFGVMILCATYTANLAAFLTASRQQTKINSIDDLVAQTKIEYGTIRGSATYQQMTTSPLPLYQEIGQFMVNRKTLMPNTAVAVEKTRRGGFAFIWDSAVLEYVVQQEPCNTVQTVGRLFNQQGYGFGLQKNSPYREELSTYILQLRETGFLDRLKDKWYKERGECQNNEAMSAGESKIKSVGGKLDIKHMLGVFYIIYGGQVLSIFVLVVEWIAKCVYAVDKDDPLSPHTFRESLSRRWRQMQKDWRDVLWPYRTCCSKRHLHTEDVDKPAVTSLSEVKREKRLKSPAKLKTTQNHASLPGVKSAPSTSCCRRNEHSEGETMCERELAVRYSGGDSLDRGKQDAMPANANATPTPKSFVHFPKSVNRLQLDQKPSYWEAVSKETASACSLPVRNGRTLGGVEAVVDPHLLELGQVCPKDESRRLRSVDENSENRFTTNVLTAERDEGEWTPEEPTTDSVFIERSISDDPTWSESSVDDKDYNCLKLDGRTVSYVYDGTNTLKY